MVITLTTATFAYATRLHTPDIVSGERTMLVTASKAIYIIKVFEIALTM